MNIISLHSYDEVKLVIVAPPKQAHSFDGFKNVPHIWSNDKKVRFFATTQEEVHFIFNKINEIVQEREDLQAKSAIAVQHYVVIVTEPELIEKEALCRYLHDADNKVGITALFAYGNITKLPKACKTIIQSDDNRTGYYIKNKNGNRFIPFTLDTVESSDLLMFAKKLSCKCIKRETLMNLISRVVGITAIPPNRWLRLSALWRAAKCLVWTYMKHIMAVMDLLQELPAPAKVNSCKHLSCR